MTTANLRKMELIVDRMHCLHAAEHAPDPVDAVVLLVARACEALKNTFSDNIAVFHLPMYAFGYRYLITYVSGKMDTTSHVYLKMKAVENGVEITFSSVYEVAVSLVPFARDDKKQIDALIQFIKWGCYYDQKVNFDLEKAQSQLDKEKLKGEK